MAHVKAGKREDRLKAALRDNLKRRKAQARGRDGADRDCRALEDERRAVSKARPE